MKSLKEQAYEHLKKMILEHEFSYQEIYSETKIAKELGISRTPFRDAIHKLVQEGYLDIIPSKGFQLHQLQKKDVEDTFQVRSALEAYCTLEITKQYQTPKARQLFCELEDLMAKLKEVIDTSRSIDEFRIYDFAFHMKIIEYLGNEELCTIFHTYLYRMKRLAALSLAHTNRMEQTYNEHYNILDAMRTGNVTDIYEITLIHMNTPQKINLEDLDA